MHVGTALPPAPPFCNAGGGPSRQAKERTREGGQQDYCHKNISCAKLHSPTTTGSGRGKGEKGRGATSARKLARWNKLSTVHNRTACVSIDDGVRSGICQPTAPLTTGIAHMVKTKRKKIVDKEDRCILRSGKFSRVVAARPLKKFGELNSCELGVFRS